MNAYTAASGVPRKTVPSRDIDGMDSTREAPSATDHCCAISCEAFNAINALPQATSKQSPAALYDSDRTLLHGRIGVSAARLRAKGDARLNDTTVAAPLAVKPTNRRPPDGWITSSVEESFGICSYTKTVPAVVLMAYNVDSEELLLPVTTYMVLEFGWMAGSARRGYEALNRQATSPEAALMDATPYWLEPASANAAYTVSIRMSYVSSHEKLDPGDGLKQAADVDHAKLPVSLCTALTLPFARPSTI